MPAPKFPEPASGKPAKDTERKPWKKKSPVEVVLDQEKKLRQEIAEIEKGVAAEAQSAPEVRTGSEDFRGELTEANDFLRHGPVFSHSCFKIQWNC